MSAYDTQDTVTYGYGTGEPYLAEVLEVDGNEITYKLNNDITHKESCTQTIPNHAMKALLSELGLSEPEELVGEEVISKSEVKSSSDKLSSNYYVNKALEIPYNNAFVYNKSFISLSANYLFAIVIGLLWLLLTAPSSVSSSNILYVLFIVILPIILMYYFVFHPMFKANRTYDMTKRKLILNIPILL